MTQNSTAAHAERVARFPRGALVTVDQLTNDPLPVLAELRVHEPVSWVPALDAWWVTDRQLVIEAMRDAERFTVDDERFTTAAVLGRSMLSLDGSEHARYRSPFSADFRPSAVRQSAEADVTAEAGRLVEALGPNRAELRTQLAGPLAVNTITGFLGLGSVPSDEVLEWYGSIAHAITDLTVRGQIQPEDNAHVATAFERVGAAVDGADSDSFIGSVRDAGELSPAEVYTSALVILFGAIETSEAMTTNLFWFLLTTPGAWDAVQADRSLVPKAIDESLRIEPAASLIDRYTTADVLLGEATIPSGELVTLSLFAANHDPDVYANPSRFDLSRPNLRSHVTFAQGPHTCLGIHLARAETHAAATALLDRFGGLDIDRQMSSRPTGLIFRKPAALWVDW